MSRYLLLILSFFSFICFTAYAQQKDIDVFSEIERIEKALELGEISEKEADAKIEELLGKEWEEEFDEDDWFEDLPEEKEENDFSIIPLKVLNSLMEMMASIDWEEISDWSAVIKDIEQLFEKKWGEDHDSNIKNKTKNQLISELKISPKNLIKDLAEQTNLKFDSPSLKLIRSNENESNTIIIQFDGELQSAPTPIGPWTNVDAKDFIELDVIEGSKFFRSVK